MLGIMSKATYGEDAVLYQCIMRGFLDVDDSQEEEGAVNLLWLTKHIYL